MRLSLLIPSASNELHTTCVQWLINAQHPGSPGQQGKLLSLQFWRDDKAIGEWRRQLDHRKAQAQGPHMFANYRLRIAEVVRDYGPKDRAQAPVD